MSFDPNVMVACLGAQLGAEAAEPGAVSALQMWLVPLLPFFGFLFQIFVGRKLAKPVVGAVSCGAVLASFVLAVSLFLEVRATGGAVWANLFDGRWISVPGAMAVLADHKLVVDQLTSVMILVITGIGFFIHLYSTGYMADEKRYARYFAFLNLFTGFMLILVMASNLLLMFVGWEGVGLCSYLLIGFWFEKNENAVAGMKAFVVNRIGDLGFTIGVLTLFVVLGNASGVWTFDFAELKKALAAHPQAVSGGMATFIGLMLFVGATGKSAQIPLFVWLPDAMAGPTPVSALIHAATMVTAGVYMIARMNFLYVLTPTAMAVIACVGAATALFAGTIGMAQNDIKKVLAYSTVSQLGFMFMGVGVGAFAAGVFHLFTHAFFKACLFLGSGSVIHGMGGEQDIRKMGALKSKMPWTYATFAIASLAIAGVPPLAGFFSKDEILWMAWNTHSFSPVIGKLVWLAGAIAALFTAFYMTRLVVKTFLGKPMWGHGADATPAHAADEAKPSDSMDDDFVKRAGEAGAGMPGRVDEGAGHESFKLPVTGDEESVLDLGGLGYMVRAAAASHDTAHHDAGHGEPHECPWSMRIALVVLALGSVVVGFLGIPHANVFEHWLSPVFGPHDAGGWQRMEVILMGVSVLIALGGIFWGWRWYAVREGKPAAEFTARNKDLYELVRDKYRVDETYDACVVQPLLGLNEAAGKFDNEVVDGVVNGAAEAGAKASNASGYFDNEAVDGALNFGAEVTLAAGGNMRQIQTGNIRHYLTFALVGGLFVIALFTVYHSVEIQKFLTDLFRS